MVAAPGAPERTLPPAPQTKNARHKTAKLMAALQPYALGPDQDPRVGTWPRSSKRRRLVMLESPLNPQLDSPGPPTSHEDTLQVVLEERSP